MKRITILSVAIATSLSIHIALAQPADQTTSASSPAATSAPDNIEKWGHHVGKHHPKDEAPQTQADETARKAAFADKILGGKTQITQQEAQALRADEFDKLDTKKQGYLTIDDLKTGFENGTLGFGHGHHPQSQPPVAQPEGTTGTVSTSGTEGTTEGKREHHQKGEWPGRHQGNKEDHLQKLFDSLDTNKDGKITKDEYVAVVPLFNKFDCDGNGIITRDDLLKGPCKKEQPTTTPTAPTPALVVPATTQ